MLPQQMNRSSDVLIVGAGPAGLSLSIALAQAGLRSTLVEQQPEEALAEQLHDALALLGTRTGAATDAGR